MGSPLVGFSIDIGKGGEMPGDSRDGGDAEVPRDGEGGGGPTWRRGVGPPEIENQGKLGFGKKLLEAGCGVTNINFCYKRIFEYVYI